MDPVFPQALSLTNRLDPLWRPHKCRVCFGTTKKLPANPKTQDRLARELKTVRRATPESRKPNQATALSTDRLEGVLRTQLHVHRAAFFITPFVTGSQTEREVVLHGVQTDKSSFFLFSNNSLRLTVRQYAKRVLIPCAKISLLYFFPSFVHPFLHLFLQRIFLTSRWFAFARCVSKMRPTS